MRKKGGVRKLGEQPRRADVAMLLFQALALLPGYSLSHTCPESLELQVSSGFFRRELYTGRLGNVKKKKEEVVREGFTLNGGTRFTP